MLIKTLHNRFNYRLLLNFCTYTHRLTTPLLVSLSIMLILPCSFMMFRWYHVCTWYFLDCAKKHSRTEPTDYIQRRCKEKHFTIWILSMMPICFRLLLLLSSLFNQSIVSVFGVHFAMSEIKLLMKQIMHFFSLWARLFVNFKIG